MSNEYGFFADPGKKAVTGSSSAQSVCRHKPRRLHWTRDLRLNVFLEDEVRSLEVWWSQPSQKAAVSAAPDGVERLSTKEIKNIPVLLGERDIPQNHPAASRDQNGRRRQQRIYVRGKQ